MCSKMQNEDGLVNSRGTALQEFYNGANVLVTGATGFMGKVLVEKLLRSCPNINTIYMLVRSKKGKNVDERVEEMTKSACFDRLKEERINFKSKLFAVEGDIGIEGLGMREQDRQLLAQNVTIVFHVAATVKFDEKIDTAIKLNVRGTRDVLLLCKTFTKLKSVIYVSTAYSNCPSSEIRECFYDPPQLTCDQAIEMAESMDKEVLNAMTPRLLGRWPNTYTFTKLLAEDAARKYGKGLPLGVFRPSIVMCTYNEPEPGWVELSNGPMSMIGGIVTGVLHTTHGDEKGVPNFVPCDMVINGMIASGRDVAEKVTSRKVIPVYNFTASSTDSITWGEFVEKYRMHYYEKPSVRAIWYSHFTASKSRLITLFLRLFLHILPALIMDLSLLVSGKKTRMRRMYSKVHHMTDVLAYFGLRSWHFQSQNITVIWNKMEDKDKELFPMEMKTINWDNVFKVTYPGLRKHLLGEDEKTVPAAILRLKWLLFLHRATQLVLVGLLLWLGIHISDLLIVTSRVWNEEVQAI